MATAADKLDAMAQTYRQRNRVYKDNFIRLGNAMHALFPQGLTIDNPQDWTRLYFFFLNVVKGSRYATNFASGGHADSVHDQAVYSAMLEAFDEFCRANRKQVGTRKRAKARNASAGAAANGRKRKRAGRR